MSFSSLLSRALPLAVIAGGIAAMSGTAQAGKPYHAKDVALSAQVSTLSDIPTLVFTPKNGNWVYEEKGSFGVRFHIKAKRGRRYVRIHGYKIVALQGSSARSTFYSTGAAPLHLKRLDKVIQTQLTAQHLKPFAARARKVCQTHGNPAKKVVKPFVLTLWPYFALGNKDYAGAAGGVWSDKTHLHHIGYTYNYSQDIKSLSARVVCQAAPFEVKSAEISVTYKGNPQSCPVEARLKVTLKANKEGQAKFLLTRDNGMNQQVNVKVYSDGTGSWQKVYNLNQPTQRKYLVTVLGHKVSTPWKTMSACLFNSSGGGLTTGTRPNRN